jgi:hypothetical protein
MWGALKLVEQFQFKERSSMFHWLVLVVHKLLNCFYTGPLFSWWFTWWFMHGCCHICLLFQMTIGPRIHFYMHLMDSGPTVYLCFHEQFFFGVNNCQKVTQYSANGIFCHKFPFFEKKSLLKGTENCVFVEGVVTFLSTGYSFLDSSKSNVVSSVEVCLGMLATVVSSVNWKEKNILTTNA